MKPRKILSAILLLLLFAGCTKTNEEKIVGLWRTTSVVSTISNAYETFSAPIDGYDDYNIQFLEGGLCGVRDRTDTAFYQWCIVQDTLLELAQQRTVQLEYSIRQLDGSTLVLCQQEDYINSTYRIPEHSTRLFTFTRLL